MLRERLISLLTEAAIRAQKEGKLPAVALPEITIERRRMPSTAIMPPISL